MFSQDLIFLFLHFVRILRLHSSIEHSNDVCIIFNVAYNALMETCYYWRGNKAHDRQVIMGMQPVDFAPLEKEKEEEKPSKPADLVALQIYGRTACGSLPSSLETRYSLTLLFRGIDPSFPKICSRKCRICWMTPRVFLGLS